MAAQEDSNETGKPGQYQERCRQAKEKKQHKDVRSNLLF